MTTTLNVGDRFQDIELLDHNGRAVRLSHFTRPSLVDEKMGFPDGYPLIVVFYRGFFCPRDRQQMRQLVQFQDELAVNYCKMVAIGVDPIDHRGERRRLAGARRSGHEDQTAGLLG